MVENQVAFEGKKILVFGLGVEGESLVEYLKKSGEKEVLIFDQNKSQVQEYLGFQVTSSSDEAMAFGPQMIFRSPGVKISVVKDIFGDIEVSSSTNLFVSRARGLIIGITGTKGKSTTANLLKAILLANGKKVFLGGNVGNSPLDFIDETDDESYTVLELSSFQLQDLKFKPNVAVFLPVTSDHMNYHKDMQEYVGAKKNLICTSDHNQILIVHASQEDFVNSADGVKVTYSERSGDAICSNIDGEYRCADRNFGQNLAELSKRIVTPQTNIACAMAVCFALKLDFDLDKVAENFEKPEYRMQKVGNDPEIEFYNDSASTNPVSVVEAVKLMDKPFALICGGSSKGLDYAEMGAEISKNPLLKRIYVIRETADKITESLSSGGFDMGILVRADSLDRAMHELALSRDGISAILFSSGSASFDQFKNYRDRGERFNRLVDQWPNI